MSWIAAGTAAVGLLSSSGGGGGGGGGAASPAAPISANPNFGGVSYGNITYGGKGGVGTDLKWPLIALAASLGLAVVVVAIRKGGK